MSDPTNTDELIATRESQHGSFEDKAAWIQTLKAEVRASPSWKNMNATRQEALDAIIVKLGRIVYGDPNFPDHWDDIAGYAVLAHGGR
jgi:hypothetical protein